jgi:hypothetical protein
MTLAFSAVAAMSCVLAPLAEAQPGSGRSAANLPALRLAGPAPAAGVPTTAPVMKLTAARGDVVRRRPGSPDEPVAAAALPLLLGRGEEVAVRTGAAELSLDSGMQILLPAGSAATVLGPASVGLLRGELQLMPRPGKEPRPLYVQGPPGGFPLKVREATVHLDGDALVVMVYDGVARPGSPTIAAGPAVNTGQAARWNKGGPPPLARALLPAPQWSTTAELFLQSPTLLEIPTRWQPVSGAQKYRLEVLRSDGDNPAQLVATSEVAASSTSLSLRGLDTGSYLTRVAAIDEIGAVGVTSVPRQLLVAQVPSLEPDGIVRQEAGSQPQVIAPPGQLATVLVDGEAPAPAGLVAGTHRLRIDMGGLSAEAPLVVQAKAPLSSAPAVEADPARGAATTATAPPASGRAERPAARPSLPPLPVTTPPPVRPPPPPPPPPLPPGPEDVLLGGVGEVPFDGVRSPWAGRQLSVRLESTFSGAARLALSGRLVMNNGFGLDLGASLLRTALTDVPMGTTATSYGNVSAALRSPALRRRRFALQALVAAVAPLSPSVLDTSAEVDPGSGVDGTNFNPNLRPAGGGWRVEPAVLLGVRVGQVAIITTQGASLRLTPDLAPSYAGGLMIHADVVSFLRFVTFAQWHVGYLGVAVQPGDSLPDVGGAAGAGFEALLPGGRPGQLRLELLGRAGIGSGGVAVYGRGTLGLQIGYRFR